MGVRWLLCLLLVATLVPAGEARRALAAADEPVSSMPVPRYGHLAVRLQDGRVLVIGGTTSPSELSGIDRTDLYDPRTNSWREASPMRERRGEYAATLLRDGRVLAISESGVSRTAELYDAAADRWVPAALPLHSHLHPPMVTLVDGKVLVAGGGGFTNSHGPRDSDCTGTNVGATDEVELFDPLTGRWAPVSKLSIRRSEHTLTALPDGGAVAIGGGCSVGLLATAERYDPTSGQWRPLPPMASPRAGHSATLLPDGRVLVAGGVDSFGGYDRGLTSATIFDPRTETWAAVPPMRSGRAGHSAVALRDGRVLVDGGGMSAVELYDAPSNSWTILGQLRSGPTRPTIVLEDGTVFVARGDGTPQSGGAAEIFSPATGRWRESASTIAARSCFPTGYCVRGLMQQYLQLTKDSRLESTGYPISNEFTEVLEDGKQ